MLKHLSVACGLTVARRRVATAALVLVALSGCGQSKQSSGQALVSVDGAEITALQLNEELQRANVPQGQQEQAGKQLVESLIDRQLLQNAAERSKIDRDPKVMQAVERAKAQIVAQYYLQKKLSGLAKPTPEDVAAYYAKHPELFAERKVFEMRQLVLATTDAGETLSKVIDEKKNLPDVARWLDSQGVKYTQAQTSRSGSDLPPAMTLKLLSLGTGPLFIVREGERSVISTITAINPAPVAQAQAAAQIEQFLMAAKSKEAAAAELASLRAAAKVEYLKATPPAASAASASAPPAPQPTDDSTARGVSGLK